MLKRKQITYQSSSSADTGIPIGFSARTRLPEIEEDKVRMIISQLQEDLPWNGIRCRWTWRCTSPNKRHHQTTAHWQVHRILASTTREHRSVKQKPDWWLTRDSVYLTDAPSQTVVYSRPIHLRVLSRTWNQLAREEKTMQTRKKVPLTYEAHSGREDDEKKDEIKKHDQAKRRIIRVRKRCWK